jgi:hypothetical protein
MTALFYEAALARRSIKKKKITRKKGKISDFNVKFCTKLEGNSLTVFSSLLSKKLFFNYLLKVQILWEGLANLKQSSSYFWHYLVKSKESGRFVKFLWLSQNILTWLTNLFRSSWRYVLRFSYTFTNLQ